MWIIMIKISTAFLEKQFFVVKNDCQRTKTLRPKKTNFPFLPPIFDEIPNKYEWQCSTFWKNLSVVFWFRRDILFWQFFDGQKNCQNEISRLNQKMVLRFFQNVEHFLSYLLGISSKIGGKWGHLVFFGLKVFILWRSFLTRKNWRIKKFFFLIRSTNLYHNDPQ